MTKAKFDKNKLKLKIPLKKLSSKLTKLIPTKEDILEPEQERQIIEDTTKGHLLLAKKVAYIINYSLFLDCLLIFVPRDFLLLLLATPLFYPIGFLSVFIVLLSFLKKALLNIIKKYALKFYNASSTNKLLLATILILLLLSFLAESFILKKFNFVNIVVQLVVYGAAISALFNKKELGTAQEQLIRKLNRNFFLLHITPLIAGRILASYGNILLKIDHYPLELYIWLVLISAMLFINNLTPQTNDLYSHCKSCGQSIFTRLLAEPICKSCNKNLKP